MPRSSFEDFQEAIRGYHTMCPPPCFPEKETPKPASPAAPVKAEVSEDDLEMDALDALWQKMARHEKKAASYKARKASAKKASAAKAAAEEDVAAKAAKHPTKPKTRIQRKRSEMSGMDPFPEVPESFAETSVPELGTDRYWHVHDSLSAIVFSERGAFVRSSLLQKQSRGLFTGSRL